MMNQFNLLCHTCPDKRKYDQKVSQAQNIKHRLTCEFNIRSNYTESQLRYRFIDTHQHFMCGQAYCRYHSGQLKKVEEELKNVICSIIEQDLIDWKSRDKVLRYLRGHYSQWYKVVEDELRRKKK